MTGRVHRNDRARSEWRHAEGALLDPWDSNATGWRLDVVKAPRFWYNGT